MNRQPPSRNPVPASTTANLQGQAILVIGYSEWGFWRSAHDWAHQLAKRNTVVFVEGFPRYPEWKHGRRMAYWKRFFRQPVRVMSERLIVVSPPPMLPFTAPLISRLWPDTIAKLSIKLSKAIHIRSLRRILRRLGFAPTVYVFHEPFDLLMLGSFGEKASCYLTYDEVSYFWSNASAGSAIEEIEREHIGKVDLVLASSPAQHEKRKTLNSNTKFLPHGVDFRTFSQAGHCDLSAPPDLEGIPSPRLGFVGVLDGRMDVELLASVASARPDWSLVLVGPVWSAFKQSLSEVQLPQNVYLLGEKQTSEVPAYLRHFDVVTIPYRLTEATNTMFPVKVYEYLAAGKAVVSTDLACVRWLGSAIRMAKSSQEYIAAIEEEMATDSPEKARARIELARQNDWSARVEEMGRLLEPMLARR